MNIALKNFKKSAVLLSVVAALITMVPVTKAFADDLLIYRATVNLKVKPTDRFQKDWYETTFCLPTAPQDLNFVLQEKRVKLRLPNLEAALTGGNPSALTAVFDQTIPENTPPRVEEQQKYRFTSRATAGIWDLQLDPSGNTSCPGVWGYMWVNKLDIYRELREYLNASFPPAVSASLYRRCIRGALPVNCLGGVDRVKMTFWIGAQKWVGEVSLEPKRKNFNNTKKTEKFIYLSD